MSLILYRPKAGLCAAAIAKIAGVDFGKSIGYKADLPHRLLRPGEDVYLAGVTFEPKDMQEMCNTCNVKFFEHRQEVIDEVEAMGLENIELHVDSKTPMAVQLWHYFFPDKEVPPIVNLAGRYMIWDIDDDVLAFNYGIIPQYDGVPEWKEMIESPDLMSKIMSRGAIFRDYLEILNKEMSTELTFLTSIDDISVAAANVRAIDSFLFKDAIVGDCKFALQYNWSPPWNNRGNWYSATITKIGDSDISANAIASTFDGGGNDGIAHFTCDELPFALTTRPGAKWNPRAIQYPEAAEFARSHEQTMATFLTTLANKRSWTQELKILGDETYVVNNQPTNDWVISRANWGKSDFKLSWSWVAAGGYKLIIDVLTPGAKPTYFQKLTDDYIFTEIGHVGGSLFGEESDGLWVGYIHDADFGPRPTLPW